jgi:hypothetical protein
VNQSVVTAAALSNLLYPIILAELASLADELEQNKTAFILSVSKQIIG